MKPLMVAVPLVKPPLQGKPVGVTVTPHPVAVAEVTENAPVLAMVPLRVEALQVATVLPLTLTTKLLVLAEAENVPFVQAKAGEAVKMTAAEEAAAIAASFVLRDMGLPFLWRARENAQGVGRPSDEARFLG